MLPLAISAISQQEFTYVSASINEQSDYLNRPGLDRTEQKALSERKSPAKSPGHKKVEIELRQFLLCARGRAKWPSGRYVTDGRRGTDQPHTSGNFIRLAACIP